MLRCILILVCCAPDICLGQSVTLLEKQANQKLNARAFVEAKALFREAKALAQQQGLHDTVLLKFDIGIGKAYSVQSRYDSAIYVFKKSLTLVKSKGYTKTLYYPALLNNISMSFDDLHQLDSALHYNNLAMVNARAKERLADYLSNRSGIFYKKNNLDSTIYYDKKALTILQKLPNTKQKIIRGYHHIAQNYEKLNQLDSSLHYYQQAIVAQPTHLLTNFVIFRGIGIVYKKQKRFKPSLEAFLKADSLLKIVRRNLHSKAEKIGLLRAKQLMFNDALTVCYALYTQTPTQYFKVFFYLSERLKANSLLDQQRQPIASVDTITSNMLSSTALLTYAQTNEHLYILVMSKQNKVIKRVATKRAPLKLLVKRYNISLQAIQMLRFFEFNKQLYQLLIKPVASQLVGIKHLVIVPSADLLNMPFESLCEKPHTHNYAFKALPYLLKRFMITYHVSATLAFTKTTTNVAYAQDFIGFSPTTFKGLPTLMFGEQEVLEAAKMFEQPKVFLHKKASIDNLRNVSTKFLHISTHGFYKKGKLAGIKLANEHLLKAEKVKALSVKAENVVLSGCETGLGDVNEYEGFTSGFVRALLANGSKSVLATIWSVQDKVANMFFVAFYKAYREHKNIIKAMHFAKLQLLNHPNDYAFPYWWTGYRLITSKF